MSLSSLRFIGFVVALLAAHPAFGQADVPEPARDTVDEPTETLEARSSEDRLTLPVDIGTHGPFDFLIDTGSEATVISGRVADQLGLPRDSSRQVVAISGQTNAEEVMLDELVIGSRRIRDLPAAVIDEEHIGAAGIIGIASLRDQRVVLDFENRQITVAPSPGRIHAGENEIVVTARRRANRLIVKRAYLDGRLIDVVIDTGSSFTIGNRALRERFYEDAPVLATTELTDVLGNIRSVSIINGGRLEIDRLRISNTLIAIADTQVFEELGLTERPALLLGMNHLRRFKRIAVDFRRKQIAFELEEEKG